MEEQEPKSSEVLAQERTDLAAERTIMAADRTLMAWLRTAIAMIGVGFTISGFFQYFQAAGGALTFNPEGPETSGAFLDRTWHYISAARYQGRSIGRA